MSRVCVQGRVTRALLDALDESYAEIGVDEDQEEALCDELYRTYVGGEPGSPEARAMLYTTFHVRTKTVGNILSDW